MPQNAEQREFMKHVVKPLEPFIKKPKEADRIRKVLTYFIHSLIVQENGESLDNQNLALPAGEIKVKKIPSEVKGLRKEYLRALSANARAKKEYDAACRSLSVVTDRSRIPKTDTADQGTSSLKDYMQLLRQRQAYEKLQILNDYLDTLSKKEAAKPDYLKAVVSSSSAGLSTLPVRQPHTVQDEASRENTDALVLRLEQSVLKAKHMLEQEKRLLGDLQSSRASNGSLENASTKEQNQGSQVEALTRTRDELVIWIEEQLAKSGAEEGSHTSSTQDKRDVSKSTEELNEEIKLRYDQYLEARKRLLAAVSTASSSPLQPGTDSKAIKEAQVEPDPLRSSQSTSIALLPYIKDHLLPLADLQNLLYQQKSYLSSTIEDQNGDILRELDRLAEESHLLAAYPMPTRPKKNAGVLGARPSASDSAMSSTVHRSQERISEWSFAADSARNATIQDVEKHVQAGFESAEAAGETVQKLGRLLGPSQEEAKIHGQRRSPWALLDGQIGFIDSSTTE